MTLRFLADHCIPISAIQKLREAGHETLRLQEVARPESPDEAVIAKAQELGAILLSLNGDFADIVAYPPNLYAGIVAFQVHNHPEVLPAIVGRLLAYVKINPSVEHYRGKLLIVDASRIRIRE